MRDIKQPIARVVLVVILAGTVFRLLHVWQSGSSIPVVAQTAPRSVEAPQPAMPLLKVEESQAESQATSEEPERVENVPAQPRRLALAGQAELPEGPEVMPGLTPATVLENMRAVFRQYNQRFGGNPVGNNTEITAALNGGNPRQVVFLNPEDGMRINGSGQLVDNWGVPFFFHQISRTEMEIRSAGPDRKMWTHDDLVIK